MDHVFSTSALRGDEWSASRPCLFTLGEIVSGTHRIDPRAGLVILEK
jgi:hypothetical protein